MRCLRSCTTLTCSFALQPFFQDMHRALRPGGVICTQGECMWLHLDLIQQVAAMCSEVRPRHGFHAQPSYAARVACRCLSAAPFHTPTPAFRRTRAAKSASCYALRPATPLTLSRRIARRQFLVRCGVAGCTGRLLTPLLAGQKPLRYYNSQIHSAAFALPEFARAALAASLTP